MSKSKTGPSLIKLPAEARNMIYKMVVKNDVYLAIDDNRQPARTRTCRQIRQECMGMYLSCNVFFFCTEGRSKDALQPVARWVRRLGPKKCMAIRRLIIILGVAKGLLIKDPRREHNPWSELVDELKINGCSEKLVIKIQSCNIHQMSGPSIFYYRDRFGDVGTEKLQRQMDIVAIALSVYVTSMIRLRLWRREDSKKPLALLYPTDVPSLCRKYAFDYDCRLRRDHARLNPPYHLPQEPEHYKTTWTEILQCLRLMRMIESRK